MLQSPFTVWSTTLNSNNLGSWGDRNGAWVYLLIALVGLGLVLGWDWLDGGSNINDILFLYLATGVFIGVCALLSRWLDLDGYEALVLVALALAVLLPLGDLVLVALGY